MTTLLLVDDNSPVREIFSLFLTRQGFEVHTADSGEACITLLGTLTPDLILLDVMMEPMDGWETLLAIRGSPKTRSLPVMMVTAKPPTKEELQKYGGDADDFVMKPVDFKTLSGSIMQVIEANTRMNRIVQGLLDRGADPGRVCDYISLLRRVGIMRNLSGRFQDFWSPDIPSLELHESRLARLEQDLGIAPEDSPGRRRAV
jgi:two-component system, OmpR family, response regulator